MRDCHGPSFTIALHVKMRDIEDTRPDWLSWQKSHYQTPALSADKGRLIYTLNNTSFRAKINSIQSQCSLDGHIAWACFSNWHEIYIQTLAEWVSNIKNIHNDTKAQESRENLKDQMLASLCCAFSLHVLKIVKARETQPRTQPDYRSDRSHIRKHWSNVTWP